tara:strand:+ start:2331 stop:3221 length:891 start_codon:yes stop_codon:yes gene_type:complete
VKLAPEINKKTILQELGKYTSEEVIKSNYADIKALEKIRHKFIYDFPSQALKEVGSIAEHGFTTEKARLNCSIGLDCAFGMYKIIKDNGYKRILNIGTGTGSSLAIQAYALKDEKDGSIISLEDFDIFNKISECNLSKLDNINKNYTLLHAIDVPFKKHALYGKYKPVFRQGIFKKIHNIKRIRRRYAYPIDMLIYDTSFGENEFDFVFIDGPPSWARFFSFLIALHSIRDEGTISHEFSRKQISWYKHMGLKFDTFGRRGKTPVRFGKKRYWHHSLSSIIVDQELRNKVMGIKHV